MSVRFLMLRYLKVNALAGIVGLAVWMAIDVIYVYFGSGNRVFLEASGPLVILVAVLAFLRANGGVVTGTLMGRFMKATLLSLPPFLLWLVVSSITILWFHPFIGGSE